jgi:hypothetical protein
MQYALSLVTGNCAANQSSISQKRPPSRQWSIDSLKSAEVPEMEVDQMRLAMKDYVEEPGMHCPHIGPKPSPPKVKVVKNVALV